MTNSRNVIPSTQKLVSSRLALLQPGWMLDYILLEYPEYQDSEHKEYRGTCVGMSALYGLAALSNKTSAFVNRIDFLASNHRHPLIDQEMKDFIYHLALLQSPNSFSHCLDSAKPHNQRALPGLSIISKKLHAEQEGADFLPPFTGAYTSSELIDYFISLTEAVNDSDPLPHPFVLFLLSDCHAVTVTFDPKEKLCWTLLDVRHDVKVKPQRFSKTFNLILALYSTFAGKEFCFFSTYIFTTGKSNNQVQNIAEKWKALALNKLLEVTPAKANKQDKNNASLLFVEILQGNTAAVRHLLASGAKSIINDKREWGGATPLCLAAELGQQDIVQILLDAGASIDEPQLHHGQTPLIFAAKHGHDAIVSLLLARGANVNAQDSKGGTAIYYACRNVKASTVAILLQIPTINLELSYCMNVNEEELSVYPGVIAKYNAKAENLSEPLKRDAIAILALLSTHIPELADNITINWRASTQPGFYNKQLPHPTPTSHPAATCAMTPT